MDFPEGAKGVSDCEINFACTREVLKIENQFKKQDGSVTLQRPNWDKPFPQVELILIADSK